MSHEPPTKLRRAILIEQSAPSSWVLCASYNNSLVGSDWAQVFVTSETLNDVWEFLWAWSALCHTPSDQSREHVPVRDISVSYCSYRTSLYGLIVRIITKYGTVLALFLIISAFSALEVLLLSMRSTNLIWHLTGMIWSLITLNSMIKVNLYFSFLFCFDVDTDWEYSYLRE